ncbi:hypothetical protein [Polyangium sp. 6x1]|uniref:hypothetical protein n=1 Tax=Polyangium sp. 6x1 TaxID=3042689 RepID=UPI002482D82C|nr:hypothetical protein [Polyangium sp. 6x1]
MILALSLAACSKPDTAPTPTTTSAAPANPAPPPAAAAAPAPAKKVTAKEVADKLTAEGILANCKEGVPKGANARASEYWSCDLPSVPEKGAGVMVHDSDDAYAATVKTYEGFALVAGSHRYGNPKTRVFVQLNEGAPLDVGKKTKAIVEAM